MAFGQLPATKGDLYVPDSGRKGYVQNIVFHNTNTSDETVVLNYYDGTSEHQILKQTIAANDSFILNLAGAGDVVQDGGKYTGNADTLAKVTYKFSGTEEILAAVASGVASNLWSFPTSAHVEDDEFEETTLSGWTGVRNLQDATDGTFSYDAVDAYDTTFNSGNVVRVNAHGSRQSWALVQVPSRNKVYSIYKAYTLPTNLLVVARMKFNTNVSSAVDNDSIVGLALVEATAGKPEYNSRVCMYLNEQDTGAVQAQSQYQTSGGTISGVVEATDVDAQGQALEYVAIHKINTTFHAWAGTSAGNWIHFSSYSGLDFTPDMVALEFGNNSTAAPGVMIGGVDFVRFYETDNFLL